MTTPQPTPRAHLPCMAAIEQITPDVLMTALRHWRLGQVAPTALLRLSLFEEADGIHARDLLLYEWVQTTVITAIGFYAPGGARRLLDASANQDAVLDICRQLLRQPHIADQTDPTAWLVLYVRWVMPEGVSVAQLAEIANLSERHLRRLVRHALRRLAARLRQATFDACRMRER